MPDIARSNFFSNNHLVVLGGGAKNAVNASWETSASAGPVCDNPKAGPQTIGGI